MLIAEFARLWFSWFLFGVLFGCLAGVLVNALCLWFEVCVLLCGLTDCCFVLGVGCWLWFGALRWV